MTINPLTVVAYPAATRFGNCTRFGLTTGRVQKVPNGWRVEVNLGTPVNGTGCVWLDHATIKAQLSAKAKVKRHEPV